MLVRACVLVNVVQIFVVRSALLGLYAVDVVQWKLNGKMQHFQPEQHVTN